MHSEPHRSAATPPPWAPWIDALRDWLAIGAAWALVYWVLHGLLRLDGSSHPLVAISGPYGVLGGLLVAPAVWAATALSALLSSSPDSLAGLRLAMTGAGVAVFSASSMDRWLLWANPIVGPPRGQDYAPLLIEYLLLAIAVLGAAVASRQLSLRRLGWPAEAPAASLRAVLAPADSSTDPSWVGFLKATAVCGVLSTLAMGPSVTWTRVLQVYFAIVAGMWLGLALTRWLFGSANPSKAWLAPIVLGLIGVIGAMISPTLLIPLEYRQLNSIPAWGLVRALPLQMVFVGTATVLWISRPVIAPAAAHSADVPSGASPATVQ